MARITVPLWLMVASVVALPVTAAPIDRAIVEPASLGTAVSDEPDVTPSLEDIAATVEATVLEPVNLVAARLTPDDTPTGPVTTPALTTTSTGLRRSAKPTITHATPSSGQ